MSTGNGNGVWKWTTTVLGSILTTGLICWFSFGGVTKTYLRDSSPYAKDRELIREMVSTNQRILSQHEAELKQIRLLIERQVVIIELMAKHMEDHTHKSNIK